MHFIVLALLAIIVGLAFMIVNLRRRLHAEKERNQQADQPPARGVNIEMAELKEDAMALSARAQAIVDRITNLAANIQTNVAAEEAAHDAANAAAEDADDTAIEGALATLEQGVGAPPAPPVDPIPAAGS
jgi:hypothetical protein